MILFIGMVASQDSPTVMGKTYNFWAGGHIVYFECVLVANLVLLRATNNWTGWGELLIFLQVTSFFWILYLDSTILTSDISYFFGEWLGSTTAWLGCLLIFGLVFIEKASVDALRMVMRNYSKGFGTNQVWHADKSLSMSVDKDGEEKTFEMAAVNQAAIGMQGPDGRSR